jgi:hypothetical protein
VTPAAFYEAMERHGVSLGPACRWLEGLWRGEGEALGQIRLARDGELDARAVLHLGAMDAAFQVLGALLPDHAPRDFVFSSLERLDDFGGERSGRLWVHAVRGTCDVDAGELVGDLTIFDDTGHVFTAVRGARLQRVQVDVMPAEQAAAQEGLPRIALAEVLMAPDPVAHLCGYLTAELAFSLRLSEGDIDVHAALAPQIDSLIAAELNGRVERNLGVRPPLAALFDGSTLLEVAGFLFAELRPTDDLLSEMLDELDGMSDEEAMARLAEAPA